MNKISSDQAFWLILGLWSLIGILGWLFHSGRQYLRSSNNVFQFLFRGALYGPVVLSVGIFVLIDATIGKVPYLIITNRDKQETERELDSIKDSEDTKKYVHTSSEV